MGRPPKSATKASAFSAAPSQSVAQKPEMKYPEAARLADKTSRTMMKVSTLLSVMNEPGYASGDPHGMIEKYVQRLNKRVNRRLSRLAKWSDSSTDERLAEFRHLTRPPGAPRQLPFSKPHVPAGPTHGSQSLSISSAQPRTPAAAQTHTQTPVRPPVSTPVVVHNAAASPAVTVAAAAAAAASAATPVAVPIAASPAPAAATAAAAAVPSPAPQTAAPALPSPSQPGPAPVQTNQQTPAQTETTAPAPQEDSRS